MFYTVLSSDKYIGQFIEIEDIEYRLIDNINIK